ncbi:MAG: hypothetical protein LQ351_007816 [Letrouitia transgressa]|nr:MAG: hypothetical protein LQ351_007816 [Letrouitia transgressa]
MDFDRGPPLYGGGYPGIDMILPPPGMYGCCEGGMGCPECEMAMMMDPYGGRPARGGYLEMPGMEHGREERPRRTRGGRRGGRRRGGMRGPRGGRRGPPEEDLAADMAEMGFEDHPGRRPTRGLEREPPDYMEEAEMIRPLRTGRRQGGMMDPEEEQYGRGGGGGAEREPGIMGRGGGRRGRGGRRLGRIMGQRGGSRMTPPGMGYSDDEEEGPGSSSEDEGYDMHPMGGGGGRGRPRGPPIGMRRRGGR